MPLPHRLIAFLILLMPMSAIANSRQEALAIFRVPGQSDSIQQAELIGCHRQDCSDARLLLHWHAGQAEKESRDTSLEPWDGNEFWAFPYDEQLALPYMRLHLQLADGADLTSNIVPFAKMSHRVYDVSVTPEGLHISKERCLLFCGT